MHCAFASLRRFHPLTHSLSTFCHFIFMLISMMIMDEWIWISIIWSLVILVIAVFDDDDDIDLDLLFISDSLCRFVDEYVMNRCYALSFAVHLVLREM